MQSMRMRPIYYLPSYMNNSRGVRERAVFRRVGRQFVKGQGERNYEAGREPKVFARDPETVFVVYAERRQGALDERAQRRTFKLPTNQ
jgi:hypothetical protein